MFDKVLVQLVVMLYMLATAFPDALFHRLLRRLMVDSVKHKFHGTEYGISLCNRDAVQSWTHIRYDCSYVSVSRLLFLPVSSGNDHSSVVLYSMCIMQSAVLLILLGGEDWDQLQSRKLL